MSRAGDPQVLLVKWYDLAKWLLERVESFPKSQRFVFGQRLADRSLAILETLVDAAWSPPGSRKAGLCRRGRPARSSSGSRQPERVKLLLFVFAAGAALREPKTYATPTPTR